MEQWVLNEALSFKLQEQYIQGVPGEFDSHCVRAPELEEHTPITLTNCAC